MRRLALILILLLCSTAVAEGPKFGIWHIDGHGYQWERTQINAGYPYEPTIRMIGAALRHGGAVVNGEPKQITALNAQAPLLSQLSGGPIVLRMNNITGEEIDVTIPRFTPTAENWQTSILCVRRVNGVLDQTPIPDPFGPLCQWSFVGNEWGSSPWMRRLQEIVPAPTEIILRDNNEGPRPKFKQIIKITSVKKKDANGVVYYEVTNAWKTRVELEAYSIRVADWVDTKRTLDPLSCESEFYAAETARYQALYAAFRASLCPAWQAVPFRTVGYGRFDENHQNDAASVKVYPGDGWMTPFLTDPAREADFAAWQSEWDADAWREISCTIYPAALTAGADAGLHDVVDPESAAGFFTAVAWRTQKPGEEVRLVWWDNYNTPPGFVLASAKPAIRDRLISLGREDVANAPVEDFELALMRQQKRINDHPTINRYWREGTTTVLQCPLNDSTQNRVYATETAIPGVERKLLFVYTPCSLTGEIEVGEWSVPAQRMGYWLTPVGLEEIE